MLIMASTCWYFFFNSLAGIINTKGPNIVKSEKSNDPNTITTNENIIVITILKIVFITKRGKKNKYSNLG